MSKFLITIFSLRPLTFHWMFVGLMICIGALAIIDTYDINSPTVDEKTHIGAGMQWLNEGRYTYELKTPPLGRIAAALGPYLAGNTNFVPTQVSEDGRKIIFANDDPIYNISLARLGILPFFIMACLVVYVWAKQLFGEIAAYAALFLFISSPPILTHSGLATTDMAFTATFIASMYAFQNWLKQSSGVTWSVSLGIVIGFCLLSKITSLLFLPVCMGTVLFWFLYCKLRNGESLITFSRIKLPQSLLIILIAFIVVWAGYRFSLESLASIDDRPHDFIDAIVGTTGFLHKIMYLIIETPLPLTEFLRGIEQASNHSAFGSERLIYLLGETRQYGYWNFFPVALFFKTPITTLFFFIGGVFLLILASDKCKDPLRLTPLICVVAILLSVLHTKINIGLRHILPIYGFITILAGYGVIKIFTVIKNQYLASSLIGGLFFWQTIRIIAIHPEYIPYFNEFSAFINNPILVDSDRDWGQTTWRLRDYVIENNIQHIKVALAGISQLDYEFYQKVFPQMTILDRYEVPQGWVAVGAYKLYSDQGYQWLQSEQHLEIIGESLYIYNLAQ